MINNFPTKRTQNDLHLGQGRIPIASASWEKDSKEEETHITYSPSHDVRNIHLESSTTGGTDTDTHAHTHIHIQVSI